MLTEDLHGDLTNMTDDEEGEKKMKKRGYNGGGNG